MLNGVHLINPDSILIEDTVVIEPSVTIDACSIIRGNTKIKSGTYIEPFSLIVDGKKINAIERVPVIRRGICSFAFNITSRQSGSSLKFSSLIVSGCAIIYGRNSDALHF